MTLQQIFDAGLPFLAALLSYGLQQAHYSDTKNTLIASGTILATGIASVWIAGQLTPDILRDTALIMTAATALQAKSLAPLQQYLLNNFFASRRSRYATRPVIGSQEPLTRRASLKDDDV